MSNKPRGDGYLCMHLEVEGVCGLSNRFLGQTPGVFATDKLHKHDHYVAAKEQKTSVEHHFRFPARFHKCVIRGFCKGHLPSWQICM